MKHAELLDLFDASIMLKVVRALMRRLKQTTIKNKIVCVVPQLDTFGSWHELHPPRVGAHETKNGPERPFFVKFFSKRAAGDGGFIPPHRAMRKTASLSHLKEAHETKNGPERPFFVFLAYPRYNCLSSHLLRILLGV